MKNVWMSLIAVSLLTIGSALGALGCQEDAGPGSAQFVDSPRGESHERMIAEASLSTAVTDEIAVLQQAGWVGGDLSRPRTLRNHDGQIAIALPFTRTDDPAALDLLYAPDGDGELRVFVRPQGATSAAVFSRSMEGLDAAPSQDRAEAQSAQPAATSGAPASSREQTSMSELAAGAALSPPTACGVLRANQGLTAGQTLSACHNGYRLLMQTDGNLVAYAGSAVVWSSKTNGKGGHHVIMQGDGNLVVYTSAGTAIWSSRTSGHAGAHFTLQDDGNLVVYTSAGTAIWSSGTSCTGCPGRACRLWRCSYVSSTGVSLACIGRPDEVNLIGRYYMDTTRTGHTNPGFCAGLYVDYLGHGKSCPLPNTLSSVLVCGEP